MHERQYRSRHCRVHSQKPEWIRRDLASKDASVRTSAEAALAAMIVNAVNRKDES
jgi:hypothetical protein